MAAITIPKIFSNIWFWFGLMFIVFVIHYIWVKTPLPPKPSKFLEKHKKTFTKTSDIILILFVVLGWLPIIYMLVSVTIEPLWKPDFTAKPLIEPLKFALVFSCGLAIFISGSSGILIGLLSVFQSNLTIAKRIFLTIISLSPIVFTALLLLTSPVEETQYRLIVKSGLGFLAACWIVNGPAIILGKHFIHVSWNILRKLRLVSGDYPG